MPEVGKNATTAHIHIIPDDGIPDIGQVRYKNMVTNQAALHLHRISDHAAITNARFTAQIGIRADAAIAANTHMALNHRAGQHH